MDIINFIVRNSAGNIYWKSFDGKYLGCNYEFSNMLGLSSPEDVIGKTDAEINPFLSEDALNAILKTDKEVLSNLAAKTLEEIAVDKDGNKRYFITKKIPLKSNDGVLIGLMGNSIDITETKKIDFELKEIKERLENVLDTIPGHVYWKNTAGFYLGCNELQAKNLGITKEEIAGKTDYDFSSKEIADKIFEVDEEVIIKKKEKTVEETADILGKKLTFLSRKVPLYDIHDKSKVIGILGVSIDITEKKKAEIELIEVRHKLDGMTLVSASIAHELRTPLASLKFGLGNIDNFLKNILSKDIIDDKKNISNKIKNTILTMDREINLANTVIDILLENVKSDINPQNYNFFSISQCINNAISRYPFKKNQIEIIDWEFNEAIDFFVEGEELIMVHVLFNLFKNSLYYTSTNPSARISIWLEKTSNFNLLYFKDTGKGISKKHLPHIFDRFFSKTRHGAGIGLSYCKMAIESLGAKIKCESEEGKYTLFKIEFQNKK